MNLLGPYRTDAILRLTIYHVFNQGYHISFNGLLPQ